MSEPFSFGLKLKISPKFGRITYLENKNETHYKYYYLSVYQEDDGWIVQTHYGRIGNMGKVNREKFPNEKKAMDWYQNRIEKKTKEIKGYERVKVPTNKQAYVTNKF